MRPALRPVPELAAALESGNLTSVDLTNDCLARIEELDGRVNAFLEVDADAARAAAEGSDARRAERVARGPLDGIPYALKDNIAVRGMGLSCASRIQDGFRSPYDATVTERLHAAGAVLVGKVSLDEFAMGSSNEFSAFGAVRNPHDPERVPGGSSGGSCAAVAAGMVPLAFGSDTGGSVRLPASFCGVVGLKPTYGRVSRWGLVAFGSSLDQIGPVARTVEGAAMALRAVAGVDPRDSTSHPAEAPDPAAAGGGDLKGLRVGVLRPSGKSGTGAEAGAADDGPAAGVDSEVAARIAEAVETLRSLGAETVDVTLPHARYGVAAYYVVASAEASSNLARFDGARYGRRAPDVTELEELYTRTRSEGFGDEVKRRIMLGTFALSAGYYDAYYGKAMRVRNLVRADYHAAFAAADVIVSPVSPTPAFPLGERTGDPLTMYLTDAYTIPANLAGIPAVSVPCGTASGGLPVGLQIQAPFLEEERLFRVAGALEAAAGTAAPPAMTEASA